MNAPVNIDAIVLPHWIRLQPLIRKAVPFMYGAMDEHDLLKAVLERRMAFFPGERCFMVAAIDRHEQKTAANIVLANGDDDEIAAMVPGVERWALNNGATELVFDFRPGLDRLEEGSRCKALGFKRRSVRYAKELYHGR